MTVTRLGALLRSRQISCAELMEQTIADLERYDRFNSFITRMWDSARNEARMRDEELASGLDRGPFHGIPIVHKDNFYTQGVRTTGGSLIFQDFVPADDAAVVERFRKAGAVCVGKANMHELAFGITSKNPHYGPVLNPADTARIAGGSSGGSAALVAAGLLPFATGSDTGGSIRVPSSYCGTVGLKPTYGRVSRRGMLPLSFSLDCPGPIASTVEDCALAMHVMDGKEYRIEPGQDLSGLRIGIPPEYFRHLDDGVALRIREVIQAAEDAGASVVEVQTPGLEELNAVARIIQLSETSALFQGTVPGSSSVAAAFPGTVPIGNDVRLLIEQGLSIAAHEFVNAQRLRRTFRRQFDLLWKKVDLLLTPATPIIAPLFSEEKVKIGKEMWDVRLASTSLVRSWNLTGEPAISIPCGKKPNELPLGVQLIGAPSSEKSLLQWARMLELLIA